MQFRTGTTDDVATLWALRARCVRETCSSHYPTEVIVPWSASPPPMQYARLLAQGGCVVAEDEQGIGQALMQRLLAMADPMRDVVLSASLNAVPFYQRQGFIAGAEEDYPHPSGVALVSVRMHRPL